MKRLPQLEERCRKDIGAGWHKIAHIATVCNHRRLLVKRIWQIHESKCRKKNCLFPIPTRNDSFLALFSGRAEHAIQKAETILSTLEFNGRAKKQDMYSSSADPSMALCSYEILFSIHICSFFFFFSLLKSHSVCILHHLILELVYIDDLWT
ncbi:hypothetical protein V6Z12_A11G376600 [Gossypium hirsutum]|uniref:Uncharacterized protein isoform X1 n=2 Tax=Gossypium TaxID=3633 RepID=A0ABM2Z0F7_GOSHI|nr:uncharacterized protein LOC107935760 isoform X1 [Gossypium hirsutum]TYG96782.1 hypothetical protein ES288_A11G380400v1 [Gossypium darwinii]